MGRKKSPGLPAVPKWIFPVLIFMGMVVAACPGSAAGPEAGQNLVTTGKRVITNQNIPRAKQEAVDEALRAAVQNAVAALVPRQALAANLEFIYDRLLAHTRDFVVTYRVLGGIAHEGNYLVGVESKINLELLEKRLTDARILNAANDKPALLFFIAEQTPGEILPKYWWGNHPDPYTSLCETILLEKMTQERFRLVHARGAYPDPGAYNIDFKSIYDADAAMDLGTELGADMVVMGRVRSSEAINRMGDEKTFDAVIELQAYDLESRRQVLQFNVKAVAKSQTDREGSTDAIAKASDLAAQELSRKLDQFWVQNLRKENTFDLAVEGEDFLSRFIALKKRFKEMPDIENIQPREIGSSSAVMEMVYKGSASQFADTLMLKTFEGFGLEIAEVTDSRVFIRFIEKQDQNPEEPPEIGESSHE
ncbi:hypothetical protein [Desulfospira joergensenii]|uniref:hypothetical protein n=1 Tax=Desulfospira joergensenii TaxID=53329 RepID=UPI0003B328FF|nr:hypothetical protein [Desulfospira joergensenii]